MHEAGDGGAAGSVLVDEGDNGEQDEDGDQDGLQCGWGHALPDEVPPQGRDDEEIDDAA